MQNIMRVFSVVLLIMVGTVFAVGKDGAEGDPQEHHGAPQSALHGTKDGAKARTTVKRLLCASTTALPSLRSPAAIWAP